MLGLMLPSLLAVTIALALGGSVGRLVRRPILLWPLAVGVFGLDLVLFNPPLDQQPWAIQIGPWLWLASRLVLLGVLLGNARAAAWRPPWVLAALGVGLNALAIAANDGHMPQSLAAAVAVWGSSHDVAGRLENTIAMQNSTRLALLGDIVPEPAWLPRANVVSVGDILLALGMAAWVFDAAGPSLRRSDIVNRVGAPIHGAAGLVHRRSH
jgi:uncharacterized protein DUF5317